MGELLLNPLEGVYFVGMLAHLSYPEHSRYAGLGAYPSYDLYDAAASAYTAIPSSRHDGAFGRWAVYCVEGRVNLYIIGYITPYHREW